MLDMWNQLRQAEEIRGRTLTQGYEFCSFDHSMKAQTEGVVSPDRDREKIIDMARRRDVAKRAARRAEAMTRSPSQAAVDGDGEAKPKLDPVERLGMEVKFRRDGILASEPSRWTRAHLPDIHDYALPLDKHFYEFGAGEVRRMLLGGPIGIPSYPPRNHDRISFPRPYDEEVKATQLRGHGIRKMFFGADGSLFREKDDVYVLGARQPMMTVEDVCVCIDWALVHHVPGGNRIGHRIALIRMTNGCDILSLIHI